MTPSPCSTPVLHTVPDTGAVTKCAQQTTSAAAFGIDRHICATGTAELGLRSAMSAFFQAHVGKCSDNLANPSDEDAALLQFRKSRLEPSQVPLEGGMVRGKLS
jgi:hypothetical protein